MLQGAEVCARKIIEQAVKEGLLIMRRKILDKIV